jgi:FKBP-type peptidyl-prolyl cis-trans isomerase FklB
MVPFVACKKTKFSQQEKLENQKDKASYAIGFDLGKNLKKYSEDISLEKMIQGIRDGISGQKSALTEEETRKTLTEFQQNLIKKELERRKEVAIKNKVEEEKFLAENAKKEGVVTTASGLQYKVIREGNGPKPTLEDTVKVHYRGTFINGKEFDSSYKRGEPVTFELKNMIPGWIEALQMMKAGSKWQIFIPSSLAYGEQGAGDIIEPNSLLIFEVELLEVVKK